MTLPAVDYARLIAPIVDRIHIAGAGAITPEIQASMEDKIPSPPAVASMLSGALPPDGATWDEFLLPTRYIPADGLNGQLQFVESVGVIVMNDQGLRFTSDGLVSAQAMVDLMPGAMAGQWELHVGAMPALAGIAAKVSDAALATGSPFCSFTARLLAPVQSNTAYDLWFSVTVARRHRADAHAAAWAEAGHTATSIVALGAGPERQSIERRTNELNASIFDTLSVDEQWTLMAGLGALNGTGVPT
jgi:hypothetical protein